MQISVTNLFGVFNHTIPLHLDDRITIIHGPNGFGKTVILKLLNALFSRDNQILRTIPFDEFHIDFDDDTSFWVIKEPQKEKEEQSASQKITFYATGEEPFTSTTERVWLQAKYQNIKNLLDSNNAESDLLEINNIQLQNIIFSKSKNC